MVSEKILVNKLLENCFRSSELMEKKARTWFSGTERSSLMAVLKAVSMIMMKVCLVLRKESLSLLITSSLVTLTSSTS